MRKLNTVLCDDAAILRARKRASLNPKLARPITANLAQTVMGYIQSSLDDFRDKETPEIKQKLTSMPIPGKFKTDSFASKIKECVMNGDIVGLAGVVEEIVKSLMNRSSSLTPRRPLPSRVAAARKAKVANIVQTVMGIIQPALDSFKNKEVPEIKQKLNSMPIPSKFKTDAFASEVKQCAQTGNASSLSGIIESLAQSLTPGKPVRSSVMPAKRKRAMDEQWLLEQAINRVVSEYPDADLDETASRVSELSGFSIVDAVKALTLMEVGSDDSISVDYPMEEGAPAMDDMGGGEDFMDDFAADNTGDDFSEEEEFPLEEEMENSGEEVSIEDAPEEDEDALEEEPEDEESEEEVKTSSLRRKAILKSQNPQQIAKDFISLPATALPRADTDNEDISAWDIVEAIASGDTDGFAGEGVYLTADCEGWKEGVRLSIIPDKAAARGRYGYGYGPQPTTVIVTSSLRRKSSTARRKMANSLSVGTRVYVPMEDAYGKVEQGMGEDGYMSILFDDGEQGYYSGNEVEVADEAPKTSSRKKALMGSVQPILYIMQEIAQVSAEESFEARKRETHATAPQDMEIPGGFEWGSLSSEIIGEATERGIDMAQAMPVIDNWIENNSTDVDSILSLDMESRINWAAGTMAARYEEALWQDPSNFGSDEDMIDPGDLDVEEDLIHDGDIHTSDLHRTGEGNPMEQLHAIWKKLSMKPEYADNTNTEKLLNTFEAQAEAAGFSDDEVNEFYDLIGPQ